MRTISIAALILLAACGSKAPPTPVKLNEDKCAKCQKPITHLRFSGIYKSTDGKFEKFDAIPCLAGRSVEANGAGEYWVCDYWSEKWVNAKTATYVIDLEQGTMTARYVAHEKFEDARALGVRNNEQPCGWASFGGK
jgi:nitrous oxide reductase accessory protein NosL